VVWKQGRVVEAEAERDEEKRNMQHLQVRERWRERER